MECKSPTNLLNENTQTTNNNPRKRAMMPRVRHQAFKVYCSKHKENTKSKQNKDNYSWLKEIGMTSSVFQLLSPRSGVGKIHLLMSKSLSSSSIAWIPLWLMRKGSWPARSRRIIF